MGPLATLACIALITAAAAVPAAAVARSSAVAFVVATWVIALGLVVVQAVALSPANLFTRPWLLGTSALACAVALGVAAATGVRPPPLRPVVDGAREVLRDPALALLAAANVVALGYSTALALFTPPGEDDAITYHLIRSAVWKQNAGIGWISDVIDLRANVSPPVAEIAVAAAMALERGERFVALPQLTALPVMAVAVYGIARKVGLARRPSALGALSVSLLPVALIQSSTAMNDVVPGALAAAVALFVLRGRAPDVAVAALSLALMLGTKTATVLVLPSLAAVVLTTTPVRRWLGLGVVGLSAIAVGSVWYLVNRAHTGDASGGLAGVQGADDTGDVLAVIARGLRYATSAIELPGGRGLDRYLYVLVGAVMIVAGLARGRRAIAWAGAIVAAVPLLLAVRWAADELYVRGWFKLGREDLSRYHPGDFSGSIVATGYTWYGPIGLALVLVSLVVVAVRVRRRTMPLVALALATAPVLVVLGLAAGLGWSGAYGRLVLPGIALSAATWGVVWPRRSVTVAVAVVGTMVALTSFVHWNKKSPGIRLLEPASQSVWTRSRYDIQEVLDGSAPFLAFVDRTVPRDATIAVASRLPPYTLFGPGLTRTVRGIADPDGAIPGDWLVVDRDRRPACADSWEPLPGPAGSEFTLLRRVAPDCRP